MLSNPPIRYALIIGSCIITFLLILPSSYHQILTGAFTTRLIPSETWYRGQRLVHPLFWQPPREESLLQALNETNEAEFRDGDKLNVTFAENRIERAAFVVLARNKDLYELLNSIREMEDRFNSKYGYPWIFLNNEPFSDEFKERTAKFTSGNCSYGLIDPSEWPPGYDMPQNINVTLATEKINEMGRKPIPYGGSITYRKMCRYQSMYFWRHPLLDDIKYYWRVEPSVKYYCDLAYDPFRFMKENKKKYGFVVSLYEYPDTIQTLWETTKGFLEKYPHHLSQPNMLPFISFDSGKVYNQCHFWSNFEIGDLSLWRSQAYLDYVEYLDAAGGFFYERWGDAPVHSIAASLFLEPDELHFFDDIGYFHAPFSACPVGGPLRNCACDVHNPLNLEFHAFSCTPHFKRVKSALQAMQLPPAPVTTELVRPHEENASVLTKTIMIEG